VDFMDGLFVPNLGMGPDVVKALQPKKNKPKNGSWLNSPRSREQFQAGW
jgi:hypothetical protein